jgi:multiple sugar transport system substrate-binding protein
MATLKGMTWSHPRGYDPMVAVSAAWEAETGHRIRWDKRSLQDFETYPVEDLARNYDLIVIDHPHVGQITAEACLLPLPDVPEITAESVGASVDSYVWQGHRWAYPIDAAAQVQAIRPDLLPQPLTKWAEVVSLAEEGRVMLPLRAPHALMCFYYMAANAGHPCRNDGKGTFVDPAAGRAALERLAAVAQHVDSACNEMDPIAVLEEMSQGSRIACAPLIYGYISYGLPGFRPNKVTFHDVPSTQLDGDLAGSGLGGTGIAVSAFSNAPEAAIAFAAYVAGPAVQRGIYADAGGQAGHRAAWTDERVDDAASGFYSGTLATLDSAFVRPRHDGYMAFQNPASDRISQALKDGAYDAALDDLQKLFDATFVD